MPTGWVRSVAAACCLLGGCKAAANKDDERRAAEVRVDKAELDVAAREEAERPPTPVPTGGGLAPGKYRVATVRVATFATTANNTAWDKAPKGDPSAAPDLGVVVKVDGVRVASCKAGEDRLEGACTFDDEAELEPSTTSTITVEVVDRDLAFDDPMGSAVLANPSVWGTGIEMHLVPQGRVKSASVTLAAVPTWWDLHGTAVIVFGAGFVVLLGGWIVLANRRVARNKRRSGARCTACGARLANYAQCSDCGAAQLPMS